MASKSTTPRKTSKGGGPRGETSTAEQAPRTDHGIEFSRDDEGFFWGLRGKGKQNGPFLSLADAKASAKNSHPDLVVLGMAEGHGVADNSPFNR